MAILIFFLLLLIGFILFNPLKVTYDISTGESKSNVMPFGIYCFCCVLVCYYLLLNNSLSTIISNFKETPKQDNTVQEEVPSPKQVSFNMQNSIDFDAFRQAGVTGYIKINPLSDFDGKTKAEIFAERKKIVDSYNGLGGANYQPSESVLGNIQDKKPWWGTEGILCKGQGENASDGMSRESSYFNNPFVLLNLGLGRVMNGNRGMNDCSDLWPEPTSVYVDASSKIIRVRYNLSEFMEKFKGTAFYDSVKQTDWFEFGNINARDFGYEYAYAFQYGNIHFAHVPNVSEYGGAKLINYWCVGQSCQKAGGCNNICPSNDAFTFYVDKYPAYASFKLYKKQPKSPITQPDAYFEVYLD